MIAEIIIVGVMVAVGFVVGFALPDALFGQPFLGKWWRIKK